MSPCSRSGKDIETAYGLEPFDCYVSAEFAGLFTEGAADDGLHVWLDVCIPEIIRPESWPSKRPIRATSRRPFSWTKRSRGAKASSFTTFGEACRRLTGWGIACSWSARRRAVAAAPTRGLSFLEGFEPKQGYREHSA